jgi:excisionase family DNA binding protein
VERKDEKLHTNTSVEADDSTHKQTEKPYMKSQEVANLLTVSKRIIDQMILDGAIPFRRIGRRVIFIKSEIDEWIFARKAITPVSEEPETCPKKSKKHHFTFQIPLEPYTNAFVEKGFLDNDNAALLNDRFSKEPKLGDALIEWRKDEYSLLAFIYVTDSLGYWGEKPSDIRKQPFFSPEQEDKEKGVRYSTLALENFNVCGAKHTWNKTTVDRARRSVNTAIIDLCEQINKRIGTNTEINAECRKSSLEYYFKYKDDKHFNDDKFEKTALEMTNLIGDTINSLKKY